MKFEELTVKDFENLGLKGIRNKQTIKTILKLGQADIYDNYGSGSHVFATKRGEKVEWKFCNYRGEISASSFLDFTEDNFKMLGYGFKPRQKLLWLQKYIKGEVDGTFPIDKVIETEEIQKLTSKITQLQEKIAKKDCEIENLTRTINKYKAQERDLKKKKDKIRKITNLISSIDMNI
jgi:hypothetical protein